VENNENDFLDPQEQYALPEKKEVVLDVEGKKIADMESLSPIEMIRLTAKENGIELKEFVMKKPHYQFDTGCRRSGCYGRGYKGWDGKIPIPCICLFKSEHRKDTRTFANRKNNRDVNDFSKKQARIMMLNRAEIYGLKNVHKDEWVSKNGAKFWWSNVKGKWDFRRVEI
jgi:hypothetical protein